MKEQEIYSTERERGYQQMFSSSERVYESGSDDIKVPLGK